MTGDEYFLFSDFSDFSNIFEITEKAEARICETAVRSSEFHLTNKRFLNNIFKLLRKGNEQLTLVGYY